MAEPVFDPSKPFETVQDAPVFDPSKPFEAVPEKPERGVLERAGSAVAETATGAWGAAKRLVVPPSQEEARKYLGPSGMWRSFTETGESLLSPFTGTVGAVTAAPQSLIASGMAGITPGPKTSEEKYEEWYPKIGTALTAVAPGRRAPAAARPAKTPEAEAARYLESEAADPAKVRADLATAQREIIPGSPPTTYQVTKDPGLAALERSAETRNTQEFRVLREQQNAARLQALEDVQRTGSPQDVADHLRAALRAEEQAAEANLVAARQQAWETSQQAGGTYDPTTYGNIFRRELQMAEDVTRANERRLWQAVDPDGTLQANPMRLQETERGIYGPQAMTETATASLTPAERQIAGLIQNYRPVIPFREMTDLRSLVSTALREELYTRGQTPAYARLSRLRQGVEEAVNNSFTDIGQQATGAAERLREASAATRERAERFRPLRDVTRREGVEGPYRMGEAAVPGRIVQSGARGYDSASNYLRAVGNERGLPDLQDAVAASMRREVIGLDGTINPRKLEGWLRRYQDTLRAIDERDGGAFSQRLRNVGTAQEALEQAEIRQAAVAAQYGKNELKSLIGAVDDADVSRTLAGIFGRVDSVQRARDLASRLTTPTARAGAQRAIIDHIRTRFISNAPTATGETLLRAEQFQNFIRHNAAALRQFLEPEQLATLQGIAADLQRMNLSVQTKMRGASNTPQDLANMQAQRGRMATLAGYAASAAIDVALHSAGLPYGVTIAKYLKGQHAARKAAKQAAHFKTVEQLVDRAMLDPDFAATLLSQSAIPGRVLWTPKGWQVLGYQAGLERNEAPQQRTPRQAGGGVPAIGGTGGRSPGATTPAGARAARQRSDQAVSYGRAQGDGQAGAYQTGGTVTPPPTPPPVEPPPVTDTVGDIVGGETGFTSNLLPSDEEREEREERERRGYQAGGAVNPDPWGLYQGAAGRIVPARPVPTPRSRPAPAGPARQASDLEMGAVHEGFADETGGGRTEPRYQFQRENWNLNEKQFIPPPTTTVPHQFWQSPPQWPSLEEAEGYRLRKTAPRYGGPPREMVYEDGGEVKQPSARERWGAAISGSITGGEGVKTGKGMTAPQRQDIVNMLRRYGITPSEWADARTTVDSRAEGGSVEEEEEDKSEPPLPSAVTQHWLETARAQPAIKPPGEWGAQADIPKIPPLTVPPRETRKGGAAFIAESVIPHLLTGPVQWAMTPGRAYRGELAPGEAEDWGAGTAMGMLGLARMPGMMPPGAIGAGGGRPPKVIKAPEPTGPKPLEGLPQEPLKIGEQTFTPGPSENIRRAAEDYMKTTERPYFPPKTYAQVDVPRAGRVAEAFEQMPHAPDDPRVRASYEAMAKETLDQFEAIKRNNPDLKIEFIKPGMDDPYAASPRLANKDILENNHLWVFPTDLGFGTGEKAAAAARANPLLRPTDIVLDGRRLVVNDVFRIVHDIFGHFKEGVGFRAGGEENAWRSHAAMYSDLARPAMTSETRGQNSWVNYGPYGERNRKASGAETTYAEQKTGLLPDWAINEGRGEPGLFPQYAKEYPPVGPPTKTWDPEKKKYFEAKTPLPEVKPFLKAREKVRRQMETEGFTPYFDPAKRFDVDPANYPQNVDTSKVLPAKIETINLHLKTIGAEATRARLQAAYEKGLTLGDPKDWYLMGQLEKAFIDELGPEAGRKAFGDRFAAPMAATTAGMIPEQNFLTAMYANYLRERGMPFPEAAHQLPYPIGGGKRGVMPNLLAYQRIMEQGGLSALGLENPKRHDFAFSFLGHRDRPVMDEQMVSGMTPGVTGPKEKYGLYSRVASEEAAKAKQPPTIPAAGRRVTRGHNLPPPDPREFQGVAWHGFKNQEGKPFIQVVNEAIERTHRLTGLPRDVILRYGIIRGQLPIYGLAGTAAAQLMLPAGQEDRNSQ